MKLQSFIKNIYHKQDGAVAIIVALGMIVLLGSSALVIDLGVSYHQASKLQNALDSAALAAVQELPATDTTTPEWMTAYSMGNQFAAANGLDSVEILPIWKNSKITGVEAKGNVEIQYTFARVLGLEKGNVNRFATAEVQVVDGMSGLLPLSATLESMNELLSGAISHTIYLKGGPQDKSFFGDNGGWRGFWSIKNGGFDVNGYPEMVRVGYDPVKTYPGVNSNATDEIYYNRMTGHESHTLENYMTTCPKGPNCPRILTIPIVEALSNQDLAVRGFASFFLEPAILEDNGKIKSISATYIETINMPGSASGGLAEDYGVHVWKLTK